MGGNAMTSLKDYIAYTAMSESVYDRDPHDQALGEEALKALGIEATGTQLRGGRDFVALGDGNDWVTDRITFNDKQSPKPFDKFDTPHFDDTLIGKGAAEEEDQWQALLKAYNDNEMPAWSAAA
jgi:hypothetical protein